MDGAVIPAQVVVNRKHCTRIPGTRWLQNMYPRIQGKRIVVAGLGMTVAAVIGCATRQMEFWAVACLAMFGPLALVLGTLQCCAVYGRPKVQICPVCLRQMNFQARLCTGCGFRG